MPSQLMAYHAAAARKRQESRMCMDAEQKRAAFGPVKRKNYQKPPTARKQMSKAIRQKTLSNYKENQKITKAKPVTRFKELHKAPETVNIEVKRLDYSAIEAGPKGAKIVGFQSNGSRVRSRQSEWGTYINRSVEQKVNADYILGHGSLVDKTKAATIMEEGTGIDPGSYVESQAGCGAAGPALIGPAEHNPEDGAKILPQGLHSRASDVFSHMVATAGCGAAGPALIGPAKHNPEDGAQILPEGRHSRDSDVFSHMVANAGCGAAGPALIGPATYNAEDGAQILPPGLHSRYSDVNSYIVQQAGCGAERTASVAPETIMEKVNDEEAEVDEEEELALQRARAPTVEQVPVVVRRPTTTLLNVQNKPPVRATPKRKRFTWKNIKRWGWIIKLAFTPKFKANDFVVNF